jgi:hypothetical protein
MTPTDSHGLTRLMQGAELLHEIGPDDYDHDTFDTGA